MAGRRPKGLAMTEKCVVSYVITRPRLIRGCSNLAFYGISPLMTGDNTGLRRPKGLAMTVDVMRLLRPWGLVMTGRILNSKFQFVKKLFITLSIILFVGIGGSAFQTLVVEAKPEMKRPERVFEKWGSSITIGVPLGAEAPYIDEENTMKWDYGDKDIAIYELPPSETYKNGGFEIDVILKERPATNKIHFTIDSQDYNFFYQAPLYEREGVPEAVIGPNGEVLVGGEEVVPFVEEPIVEELPAEVESTDEGTLIPISHRDETSTDVGEPAVEEITPPAVEPESETPTDVGEPLIEETPYEPTIEEPTIEEPVVEESPSENNEGLSLQWIKISQAEEPAPEVEPVVEEITPPAVEPESETPTDVGEPVVEEPAVEETPAEPTSETPTDVGEPTEENPIADIIRNLPDEEKYLVGEVDYCTATDCYNIFGMVISHRPENVVGSYAVYHKTKRNHKQGEENYRTGKVAHIYRPKIIDANGDWVWGEMRIHGNQLVVSVPQDFLDNGVYPITVDPAIGYTSDPDSTDLVIQNIVWAFNYSESDTMPEDGTAQSVWVWWGGDPHDVSNAMMGIYSDLSGAPRGLTDDTTEKTSFPAGVGWLEFTGANASLISGRVYYPVWWHNADWQECTLGVDDVDAAYGTYWLDNETYDGSFPATLTNDGGDTWKVFAAYIEYTTGSPPEPAAPPKPPPIPIIMF